MCAYFKCDGVSVNGFAISVTGYAISVTGFAISVSGNAISVDGNGISSIGFAISSIGFAISSIEFAVSSITYGISPIEDGIFLKRMHRLFDNIPKAKQLTKPKSLTMKSQIPMENGFFCNGKQNIAEFVTF